jgi:c-di-AMP phosphodiesterase-like protein
MDMALGRGGDQSVIKTRNNFEFYGGKAKAVEKRTKVKSRIMAESLRSLIAECDNVIVMGHKFADFDSLGASIGIARIARILGKPVNIVLNRTTSLTGPVVEVFDKIADYNDLFVDPSTGLDCLKFKTLLVICDVHSPEYLESPDIYRNAGLVAVIDHHRKMADYITNANFNYHEPYASSACEIVTELLQYLDGDNNTTKEEAGALLSGIVLDTKNFCFKTSFRTFEAAAYLRRIGADPIEVKKIFQSGFGSYVRKTEFIQAAEFYFDHIAISIWNGEPFENAKTVMSQAADELLSIEGVEASFVLYPYGDTVHLSSRSLGTVNVQLIMEALGGGGHLTTAGAQITGDVLQVKEKLLGAIRDYFISQNEEI